jgi:hypothetical protein
MDARAFLSALFRRISHKIKNPAIIQPCRFMPVCFKLPKLAVQFAELKDQFIPVSDGRIQQRVQLIGRFHGAISCLIA